MQIVLNGERREVPAEVVTVADLLRWAKAAGPGVAVEINRAISPRREHADRELRDGDVVEVVTLVGGG